MTDSKVILEKLTRLGLSKGEAIIYIKLLEGATTHLRISRETGITRSSVYRLVESLERQSLVTHYADDTGRFITASGPENFAISLAAQEERLKERRATLSAIMPALTRLQAANNQKSFTVSVYEGSEGLRQMLWHELKAKGEVLIFGGATIEELTRNPRWAERHRAATLAAGYRIREIGNENYYNMPFTSLQNFHTIYTQRCIDKKVLSLSNQISIYNDTVNTYHWREDQKIGFEVVSAEYAATMKQMFESYWAKAAAYD